MKRQLFYFFLFMCLAFPLNTTAQVVDIPDSNLRAAVEDALGVASGDTITASEMATLTRLEAREAGIRDLTGLEHATNLTYLDFWKSLVSDISPVAGLANLTHLGFAANNAISDVSALAGLTNLTELFLNGNSISDISVLAGLTNLTRLSLTANSISDISALADLTNLTWLKLGRNSISDISALVNLTNLTYLELYVNTISDPSPVAGLTNLTYLNLAENSISNISALVNLTNLTHLELPFNTISDLSPLAANTGLGSGDEVDVRGNPLNRASIQTHIPALQSRGVAVEFDDVVTEPVDIPDPNLRAAVEDALGVASGDTITASEMATLTRLEASEAGIRDLTGLEGATNLTRLDLGDNVIRDISVLAGLTNLTKLSLDFNNITDISVLAGLPNLIDLALGYNAITDHSILSGLTNLTSLDLRSTNTSDLSMLSGLTKLERLYIDRNGISDLAPLAGLTNLTRLGLVGNDISDVSPLRGLTNLKWMRLAENNITDLSPLVANTGLGSGDWIDVKENPLNYASIKTHIPALQSRGVAVEFDDVVAEPVDIPDPNLRAAIESTLGVASGDTITTVDMGKLIHLGAPNANISDLTGLEDATNLTSLDLGTEFVEAEGFINSNSVSDLSPVAGLTNLTSLSLDNNTISDISPVAGLTSLTSLNLWNNTISDISPVAGLTNLTWLHLERNLISDLSAVAGLTNLTMLILGSNTISDLSAVAGLTNLTFLSFSRNSISDLSAVAGLTNLTTLSLWGNSISDLSPVVANTGLGSGDRVGVQGNPLSYPSIHTHIPTLQGRGVEVGFEPRTPTLRKISGVVTMSDNRLIVEVRGNDNLPFEGVPVTFTITSGGGTLSVTNTTTDENGRAESELTLGADGEPNSVEVSAAGTTQTVTFSEVEEPAVDIPDLNLRAAIENGLGKGSGSIITTADMGRLTELVAQNSNITDLTGLEHATNLARLDLGTEYVGAEGRPINSNSVSDLSPLAGLTNLTFLSFSRNSISDLSPLAGLTSLTWLYLWNNTISDLSPVAGLTNLTQMGLRHNNISDLSPLAGLTNLTWLDLRHNNISDLPLLAANTGLESGDEVLLNDNPLNYSAINTHIPALKSRGVAVEFDDVVTELVDIPDPNLRAAIESTLGVASGDTITTADMGRLTELVARNSNISDLTGLEDATNLIFLALGREYVEAERRFINSNSVSDLSPLAGLTNLIGLFLDNNSISDLSPLAGLNNLTELRLGDNSISDISSLSGLTNLTFLILDNNSISDISSLSGLTNLTSLSLGDNSISDISPVAGLTNLTSLSLGDNSISDISPVAGLTNLTFLILDNNSISDISPVAGLTNLTFLILDNNSISDISPVAGLTNLTSLRLDNNSISDISPVAGLTNLISLSLGDNSISDISPVAGLTNLTFLILADNSIVDLSPLVENTGLGERDWVDVKANPLSFLSIHDHIPALRNRGVTVEFIRTPTALLKISGTVTESDNLLIVEVRDDRGRLHEGVTVTFTVISGGGTLSATSATTDANGRAESRLTLGPDTGTNRVRASVEGISESVTFSDVPEPAADIPDPNLRAAIAAGLGKASDAVITTDDMARLTELFARNVNISNLAGLEAATNLTLLFLGAEYVEAEGRSINSNSVSDLSPLAGLTNLTGLYLDNNSISDISPLAGLTNLTSLSLGNNTISDISPVAGLTNLTSLSLDNNAISDISPLAGLTNLTRLYLSDNAISDISPLAGLTNLTSLELGNNSISDLSPVAGLTNLTSLGLENNSISDLSPVAGLTNLTFLILWGNSISDISAVVGLNNLTGLSLGNNSITDISAVAGLTNLTFLILADNSIVDLSPLVENTGLGERDWVDVKANPLSFPSIYTHIPALQSRGVRVGFDPQLPDLLSGHTAPVVSVAFSSRGTLASGSQDGTVILWDAVTEQAIATLMGHTASARSVAFSPEGSILASGSHDGTVILWDVATQQPKDTLTEHTAPVETVAFSPDGSTLASGSQDGTVILWDVDAGQPKDTIMGHANKVWSLAFSPDGTLAIGRDDGTVLLWDVATGQPKDTLTGHTAWVESVAFTRDGSMLASGSGDNTVILWEVATGRPIVILPGHTAGVNSVAFSPDGTMLASGSDDTMVRLWDVIMGQPIATLTGHTSWVRSVAFSPDGSTLASGSGDRTVLLWEIAPGPLEYTLSIPAGLNLIHVPLKVTAVDGVAKTIESISDLYDALGGASKVIFLATHDSQTQQWAGYFGPADKGTPVDKGLTDDMGILANMIAPTSVRLSGNPLGTNGTSTITLNPEFNVVGLPLRDSSISRVSDLLALDGIRDNVHTILFTDNGDFKLVIQKLVIQATDPSNIPIVGGQAFMLYAQRAETVTISGEGWDNTSAMAAAPPVRDADLHSPLTGIQVTDTTPVLGLKGLIVDEGTGLKVAGFRVTVKNLSAGGAATAVTGSDEPDYRLIIVDIETERAAMIGDILEISTQSPNPFIGVKPLRYTVTAEDVLRSLIQLPELAAYEIPSETQLLANYPNPFNPETWIPYRLAEDAFVTLTIYNLNGQVVRTLDVGHQIAAVYESRSKAVYWDGRNQVGESVASGVYFYHLSAGDYSATRKMLIIK